MELVELFLDPYIRLTSRFLALSLPPFTASCSTLEELSGPDTSFSFSLPIWHCRPDLKARTVASALINAPLPSSGYVWKCIAVLSPTRLRKCHFRCLNPVFLSEKPASCCLRMSYVGYKVDGNSDARRIRAWYTHEEVIFHPLISGKNMFYITEQRYTVRSHTHCWERRLNECEYAAHSPLNNKNDKHLIIAMLYSPLYEWSADISADI